MKFALTSLALAVLLIPEPATGVTFDNLVKRGGLFYKRFSDVPFTGRTNDMLEKISFQNGKRHGPWIEYYENGQLLRKGAYEGGKPGGPFVQYSKTGQLEAKGSFRNGHYEGPWVFYWENGQLMAKGAYKTGFRTGAWMFYWKDGTVWKERSGTYRDGRKIPN